MKEETIENELPGGVSDSAEITREELQLAARNHGMPLEAMRHDVTPVGLHYLLIHYDIPDVDPASWRLEIGGSVERPGAWSLPELQSRPAITAPVTMECAGNGRAQFHPRPISQPWLLEAVGTGAWTGVLLRDLLEAARLRPGAREVVFTGLDRGVEGEQEQFYERSLPLPEALGPDPLLAFGLNGGPLPPQHGFPLRLVVPGWYGMASVKWLRRITVIDTPYQGYQHTRAYRFRREPEEDGTAVSRILPRALMVPPGIPDFLTRRRVIDLGEGSGEILLQGRAWSGWGPITRVEVSADRGKSWTRADLSAPPATHAWQRWTCRWRPAAGEHELCCRAADASGREQPAENEWNLGGYAGNAVQRVAVVVRES
jgi:DMSO/TMAO reductase YedYZ molybdopterin-dependent catalytic subunit